MIHSVCSYPCYEWRKQSITPIKPSGHYVYRTVVTICTAKLNIQQFYVLPTQCIYVFCVDLRTNSDYFPIQHQLTGFHNRDGVCLLRGTDYIFKYNSGLFGPYEICCGRSDIRTGNSVFPCQYHSTVAPCSSLSTCCSYEKDKRAKPGNLPKSNAVAEIGEPAYTFLMLEGLDKMSEGGSRVAGYASHASLTVI